MDTMRMLYYRFKIWLRRSKYKKYEVGRNAVFDGRALRGYAENGVSAVALIGDDLGISSAWVFELIAKGYISFAYFDYLYTKDVAKNIAKAINN